MNCAGVNIVVNARHLPLHQVLVHLLTHAVLKKVSKERVIRTRPTSGLEHDVMAYLQRVTMRAGMRNHCDVIHGI